MPLDQETTLTLLARHGATLLAVARSWTDDGEDLVQEALCKLVTADPPPTNPAAWLFQVVRNEARQLHRATGRRTKREQAVAKNETGYSLPQAAAEQNEVIEALNRIPIEMKEIVIMRLWSDLTWEEIANSCQISTATAHRQYKQAIEMVQRQLGVQATNPSRS